MALDNLARRNGRHHFLGRSPEATPGKQLARNRSERLARRPEARLGAGFFLLLLASLAGGSVLLLVGAVVSVYAEYSTDLPPVTQLTERLSFKTTRILDRSGRLLYEIYDKDGGKRTPIHLGDVAQPLIDATIATEDKDFYSNPGFDPAGVVRAISQNVNEGQIVSGASTITQQLAKNVLLAAEERTDKSYGRKIREAILALRITREYPKDEILEMYLNEVYYGHLSYGIEAASETYFGKHAADLNLAEAALLAGLPQAPSQYDPYIDFTAAKERQSHVLGRMVDQGYITPEDAERASTQELRLRPRQDPRIEAPHFVMYVRQLLERKYGANMLYRGGLKVTTTLNLDWNRVAEMAIRDQLQYLKKQNANNSSLVSVDPRTGEILAMVGSKDYYDSSIDGQVNVATSRRQPGSTIKPLVYVGAFAKGWAPGTVIVDERTAFQNTQGFLTYRPFNFDGKFDGAMTIRHALSNSKNIPAVKTLLYVGIPTFVKLLDDFGVHIEHPEAYGYALGLGAGEVRLLDMAGAYGALANNGIFMPPVAILRVEDAEGNVLEDYQPPEGRQVVSAVQAYMVTSILADNTAREPLQGEHSPLRLSRPAAAKTGSTDDYKDSWTIGYTPDLATGVWVGNTDSKPMKEVLGSLGAGRIWHQYMEDVHAGAPVLDFVTPPGIREFRLCKETGQPYAPGCRRMLVEVYPEGYDYARHAVIPDLPPVPAGVRPLGEAVSPAGVPLQPTATPDPREFRPAPPAPPPATAVPTTAAPLAAPPPAPDQPVPAPDAPPGDQAPQEPGGALAPEAPPTAG